MCQLLLDELIQFSQIVSVLLALYIWKNTFRVWSKKIFYQTKHQNKRCIESLQYRLKKETILNYILLFHFIMNVYIVKERCQKTLWKFFMIFFNWIVLFGSKCEDYLPNWLLFLLQKIYAYFVILSVPHVTDAISSTTCSSHQKAEIKLV